jgi:hypothetical protein
MIRLMFFLGCKPLQTFFNAYPILFNRISDNHCKILAKGTNITDQIKSGIDFSSQAVAESMAVPL